MVFSSLQFIFIFLPIFFSCYYLVPHFMRNLVLLIGSLIFYFIGTLHNSEHFIIFIMSMIVDFEIGKLMGKYPKLQILLLILFYR